MGDERLGVGRMSLRQIVLRLTQIDRPRLVQDCSIGRLDPFKQPCCRHDLGRDVARDCRVPDTRQRKNDVPIVAGPVFRLVPLRDRVEKRACQVAARDGIKELVGLWTGDGNAVAADLRQDDGQVVVRHGRFHDACQQICAQPLTELEFPAGRVAPRHDVFKRQHGDFKRAQVLRLAWRGRDPQQRRRQRAQGRLGGRLADRDEQIDIAIRLQASVHGGTEQMDGDDVGAQMMINEALGVRNLRGDLGRKNLVHAGIVAKSSCIWQVREVGIGAMLPQCPGAMIRVA